MKGEHSTWGVKARFKTILPNGKSASDEGVRFQTVNFLFLQSKSFLGLIFTQCTAISCSLVDRTAARHPQKDKFNWDH